MTRTNVDPATNFQINSKLVLFFGECFRSSCTEKNFLLVTRTKTLVISLLPWKIFLYTLFSELKIFMLPSSEINSIQTIWWYVRETDQRIIVICHFSLLVILTKFPKPIKKCFLHSFKVNQWNKWKFIEKQWKCSDCL